jgi:MFS family permease
MAGVAFVTCFIACGVQFTFGVFFKPMAQEFGASHASAATIFAVTSCLTNLFGIIGGHLADRFGPRRVIIAGATSLGLGLFTTSRIAHIESAYLTYGVFVGIGVALTYVPVLAMVAGWFLKRRTSALGITVSGIGCGTFVCAPLAAAAIEHFGWRVAYRLTSLIATAGLLTCAVLAKAPPTAAATGANRLREVLRTRPFITLYATSTLSSMAIFVSFVYLPAFAQLRGIGEVRAAALIGFIGASSVAGRLGLGALADRFEALKLYKTATCALGLSFVIWAFPGGYASLVAFAIVMGTAYGGWVVMLPAVLAEIFGVEGLGATLGAVYSGSAISAIIGTPLAGFMIDKTGSYLWAAALAGGCTLAGFLIVLPLQRGSESATRATFAA